MHLFSIHVDMLTIGRGILVHQVSMRGVMGAGLARQIAKKWPVVYDKYMLMYFAKNLRLGYVIAVQVSKELWVASLVGQENIGVGRRQTDYAAVQLGLERIKIFQEAFRLPVYLPHKMGCGLGGGDWSTVESIIKTTVPDAVVCIKP